MEVSVLRKEHFLNVLKGTIWISPSAQGRGQTLEAEESGSLTGNPCLKPRTDGAGECLGTVHTVLPTGGMTASSRARAMTWVKIRWKKDTKSANKAQVKDGVGVLSWGRARGAWVREAQGEADAGAWEGGKGERWIHKIQKGRILGGGGAGAAEAWWIGTNSCDIP